MIIIIGEGEEDAEERGEGRQKNWVGTKMNEISQ